MIKINATTAVIVEGILKANGLNGTSSISGGSGGCILIDTYSIEGKGTVQVRTVPEQSCHPCIAFLYVGI